MILNMKRNIALIILLMIAIIFTACTNEGKVESRKPLDEPISKTNTMLGTVVTIKLYEEVEDEIFEKIFDRLREIETRMTINEKDSEIIEVNKMAGKNFVKVSDDTFYVVEKGKYYSELSEGKFDISIGPLVKLWDIGSGTGRVPTQEEIDKNIKLVNFENVSLDKSNNSIKLEKEGMILDLGGIAKGFAADETARILKENNVNRGILNLGGNIYAYGDKPNGDPWNIGIQNPFSTRGEFIGLVSVIDKTIVTSGIYERYFEENGKRYHHILDPKTGFPVDNNLAGVSIVAASSIDADSLSTSLFSLGLTEGMKLIESIDDAEAIFVTKDLEIYLSSGLKDNFRITDNNFKLIEE